MIIIDPVNYTITLPRGDTGSFTVSESSGHVFTEDDRAVFTVRDNGGAAVIERYYALDDVELGNGKFLVSFINADTDELPVGTYTWDVRYVINPYYDAAGRIVSGDRVETPRQPMMLTLLATVGTV